MGRNAPATDWPGPWHTASLSDGDALKAILSKAKPDYIFHLAALLRNATLAEFLATNVVGTANLFQAILEEQPGARVLVAGSSAEYGVVSAQDLPISERCPLRPLSPYGLSKVSQDLLASQFWYGHGLSVVRVRTFNLTGPGEPPSQVASGLAMQIAMIEAGRQKPEIEVGNLDTVRDFIDVRDAVQAYWNLMTEGQPGEVYNVCSGQGVQIKAVLDTLLMLASKPVEVKVAQRRFTAWDVPIQIGNPERWMQLGCSKPQFSLTDSLKDLLDEWRTSLKMEQFCEAQRI
jgi:GDP-4-dehydro-6-deoxy-D-mannose reductase